MAQNYVPQTLTGSRTKTESQSTYLHDAGKFTPSSVRLHQHRQSQRYEKPSAEQNEVWVYRSGRNITGGKFYN